MKENSNINYVENILKGDGLSPNNHFRKKGINLPLIVVLVIMLIIAIIIAIVGFASYFINPVKEITTKIRETGKSLDEIYDDSNSIELLKSNDKINGTGEISAIIDLEEKYNFNLDYGMILLKNNNEIKTNINAEFNNKNLIDLETILLENELFVKLLEGGTYFKSDTDNTISFANLEEELNKIYNNKIFTKISTYLADAIDHNVSKKHFIITKEKINVNNKKILTNKYSLTLKKEMVNGIIKDFINSLKSDGTLKELFNIDAKDLYVEETKVKLNVYVSIKGVIKAEVVPADENTKAYISYTKINEEHKELKVNIDAKDFMVANIYEKEDKLEINVVLNVENAENKIAINIELAENGQFKFTGNLQNMSVKLEGKTKIVEKGNNISSILNATITISIPVLLSKDIIANLDVKSTIEANDDITINIPSNAIDINTQDSQSLFMSEFEQTGLYKFVGKNIVTNQNQMLSTK